MRRGVVLSLLCAGALFGAELDIQKVVIEEEELQTPTLQSDEVKFTRQQDLAEILAKYIPEINMVRASAIGNDIVLRGFKRDDINVLIDGAKVYGACPNRMDPPLMHTSIADIQSIQVLEGPFDVENFGSMGGAIKIITKDPQEGFGGNLEATLGSYGYNKFDLNLHAGDEKLKMQIGITRENSEQYEDGNGRTLVEQNWDALGKTAPDAYQEKYKDLDAYTRSAIRSKVVYNIADNQTLKLSLYSDKATNVLYPAFQMDAQLDETLMLNANYTIKNLSRYSKALTIETYYSSVKHDMGTEFRNSAVIMGGKMYRTHHVESRIKGAKVKNSFELASFVWTIGLDGSVRKWNGICLNEPSKTPRQVRIPNVETKNSAIFLKGLKNIDNVSMQIGLRYDNTDIKAKRFDDPTIANIAAVQNYYKDKHSKNYNDVSANVVVNYNFDEKNAIYVGLGQGIRVPDGQELYFVGFMMGNWSRKGNPYLKESKNRELDIGYKGEIFDTSFNVNFFYSDIKDYIYAYKSNEGNVDPNAYYLTWTNIDAHIYGASLSLQRAIGDYFMVEGGVSYQRGKKDDLIPGQNDDDLAQIPPMHGRLALSYDDGEWYMMAESIMSAGWRDYDADNGERHVGGWGVVNLKASKDLTDNITLHVGVDNLFDKTYAVNNTYVGRALIGGRTPVLINEPGRYLYANVNVRF